MSAVGAGVVHGWVCVLKFSRSAVLAGLSVAGAGTARAAGLAQALGGVIVGLVCARGTVVVVVVVVFCCGCVAGKEEKV